MVNAIYIDLDSERELPINFGKPPEIAQPANRDEAQTMILNDIATLAAALATLISAAHDNGYGDAQALVNASLGTLTSILPPTPANEP